MRAKAIFAITFSVVAVVGCTKKQEDTPNIINEQDNHVLISQEIPDSIRTGINAFELAAEDFKAQSLKIVNTSLLLRIVNRICRNERQCASRTDPVAYKNDVKHILDSLVQNNILDSLINNEEQLEIKRKNRDCSWTNNPEGGCPSTKPFLRRHLDSLKRGE